MTDRTYSTYAILLDEHRGKGGARRYCAYRRGSLEKMRTFRGQRCEGEFEAIDEDAVSKEHIEAIRMRNKTGQDLDGEIAKLSTKGAITKLFAGVPK